MHRPGTVFTAAVLLLLTAEGSAIASSIISLVVDPGPVGAVSGEHLTINLSQLAGAHLSQGETLIDIHFDHGKYVELWHLTTGGLFGAWLNENHTPSTAFWEPADGDGGDHRSAYYLFDQAGEPLLYWNTLVLGSGRRKVGLGTLRIGSLLDLEGAMIHGVHLGFDASDDFQLASATLSFYLRNPGRMQIGSVPEPSSFVLGTLASMLLGGRRVRRALLVLVQI